MATPAAWSPDQPLIRMRDVFKKFGAATILDGISFDVMKGQVICIIGPSGAGKSTLLRCINALVRIDSGSILVEGQEVNDPKLDKLALRIQQMPNGKVAIVGFTDQTEVVNAEQLGAQRAVNVKYYLTTDELGPKLDPTRLEPRKGGTKGKAAHFYFVPQGATFSQEESVTVDESVVQGQSRSAPAPKKKAKKAPAAPSGN